MLFVIKFMTWICITCGIYMIFAYKLKLPSFQVNKAVKEYSRQGKKNQNLDELVQTAAKKIEPYIKMNEYKKSELQTELNIMNIDISAELFKATGIAKAILILLLAIPCLLVVPIGSVVIIFISIMTISKDENKLKGEIRKKKEAIELELPRFASTIKQEITATRDVLAILDNYKRNAGDEMKRELEITVADMRSGNYESALLRFEGRISSPILSDIIRGLLGTLRGDDNKAYFEMLSHDLDEMEVQRLKAIAAKQPDKITKYSFMVLLSAIGTFLVILGVYAFKHAQGIL